MTDEFRPPRELSDAEAELLRFLVRRHATPELQLEDCVPPESPLSEAVSRALIRWREILGDAGGGESPLSLVHSFRATFGEGVDPEVSLDSGPESLSLPDSDHAPVARYLVLEDIGQTDAVRSSRVWDTSLRRRLIKKVFEDSSSSSDRFRREVQMTARLDHPGIVPVHDAGIDSDGCPFVTLEDLKGAELGTILSEARNRRAGWNPNRVVAVLQKVCETVSFAHSQGIIHAALDPSRVIVGDFGQVYVVDWGDALVSSEPLVTSLDLPAPAESRYRAPELAATDGASAGPWSDVYSVGAMLCELLCGEPPGPRPDWPDGVSPRLCAICEKSLVTDLRERYQSLGELTGQLRAYLEEQQRIAEEEERARFEARSSRQVADFLMDIFLVSDPSEARGHTITAREVLDRGAERIPRELGAQPATQAVLQKTLARIYRGLGLEERASKMFREAVATHEEAHGTDHDETKAVRQELADLLGDTP